MKLAAQPSAGSHRKPPLGAFLLVPVIVAVALTLFAWPSARQEPRDLPIGLAGPSAATQSIEKRLATREGAFELHRYADEAAARDAVEIREVYGAFVAAPAGAKVLTASAASSAVTQMLTQTADESGAAVVDVVPASPRAAAMASSVLPLVTAGILTGVMASLLAAGGLGRAGLVVAGSALGGLVAAGIVQSWLDVVEGDFAANAGALSLTILAIASVVAGLQALLGTRGIGLAAATMVFVGNPFSGVGSAPELLPQPVGALGQLLPPGAGGNLLRSTGLFDGAGGEGHVLVLVGWALAGMGLMLAASLRRAYGEGAEPEPAGAAA
jgi:hypothetical protein